MYWPTKRNEWWLCGVLLTQAIITIALEIYIFVEWQSWVTPTIFQVPVSYLIPINLAILIFACVYESVLTLDAIHNKNNILLFAICISNACSFAYAVMQYQLMETTTTRLFHDRFGYPTLIDTTRNVWSLVQPAEVIIFLVLIKVNFYFLIGFIIQYNLIYVHTKNLEWTLAMCLIPAAFICMLLGVYFVQHERTWGVIGIIVCYLGVIAYLISRIIILFEDSTLGKDMMLLFAFASLVLTVATVVCAIVCITNFDRGFKKINRSKNGSGRSSQYSQANSLPLSNPYLRPPSRLTLE
ncbi:hypothetical protein MYU51_007415 [Penicillium brevicompactum]